MHSLLSTLINVCTHLCSSIYNIEGCGIEQSHDQLPQTAGPLYEELQPSTSTPECQDLVELKENVAYRPIMQHNIGPRGDWTDSCFIA